MSMNVIIIATRKISFKKKNGEMHDSVQMETFRAWQTPTCVTDEILASKDPAQAYVDWILRERSRDQEWPVYADDDILGDGVPVGTRIVNEGKEHVEDFREWVEFVEEQGFTVKFEMI
jgi:hypothetical protein